MSGLRVPFLRSASRSSAAAPPPPPSSSPRRSPIRACAFCGVRPHRGFFVGALGRGRSRRTGVVSSGSSPSSSSLLTSSPPGVEVAVAVFEETAFGGAASSFFLSRSCRFPGAPQGKARRESSSPGGPTCSRATGATPRRRGRRCWRFPLPLLLWARRRCENGGGAADEPRALPWLRTGDAAVRDEQSRGSHPRPGTGRRRASASEGRPSTPRRRGLAAAGSAALRPAPRPRPRPSASPSWDCRTRAWGRWSRRWWRSTRGSPGEGRWFWRKATRRRRRKQLLPLLRSAAAAACRCRSRRCGPPGAPPGSPGTRCPATPSRRGRRCLPRGPWRK